MSECRKNTTTYQYSYKGHPSSKAAVKAPKVKQNDPELVSGNFTNNIKINGAPVKSKTWPIHKHVEEYKDFLKRFECCENELFKLYYRCPYVDMALLERMVRNLEKTVYQLSYSPNEYQMRKRCRFPKTTGDPTDMKFYDTTYRTYYNRIEELRRYKDVLCGVLVREDQKEELRNELQKIYKLGRTTYNDTLCIPVNELYKNVIYKNAPIDRYTLRRI